MSAVMAAIGFSWLIDATFFVVAVSLWLIFNRNPDQPNR